MATVNQHPRSMQAWSHNALRGSSIRVARGSRHHFIAVQQAPTTTDRAKYLAGSIMEMMEMLTHELTIRVDHNG